AGGFEPPSNGFADRRLNHLATPPFRAVMTLATPQIVPWPIGARGKLPVRRRRPRSARGRLKDWSGKRDLNPRPQPWQGCALPLSYSRPNRLAKDSQATEACQADSAGPRLERRDRKGHSWASPATPRRPRVVGKGVTDERVAPAF